MPSDAYTKWDRTGRPHEDARPIASLGATLRAHGYTVWTLGDESHLQANPPQDHVPFGRLSWPGPHPYPLVLAMDVPDRIPKGCPDLPQLAAQIFADKQARVPGTEWLRYMNWEPEGVNRGPCYNDSWQPDHQRENSDDRGHIHLSCRTDYAKSDVARGYDPVARFRGQDEEHEMNDAQNGALRVAWQVTNALRDGSDTTAGAAKDGGGVQVWAVGQLKAIAQQQSELLANLQALAGKDFVNEQQIVDGVLQGLGGKDVDQIAEALTAVLTPDKRAALAAKLAAG
jgi:hypothetical protein